MLTVVVLNYHHRKPDNYKMPNWVSAGIRDACLLAQEFRNEFSVIGGGRGEEKHARGEGEESIQGERERERGLKDKVSSYAGLDLFPT